MQQKITSYRDLLVWQRASELALAIYELTEKFPQSEQIGLTLQLQRAAVSICSNIAEGYHRSSRKEYIRFLYISYGSGAEVETQLNIARQLRFGRNLNFTKVDTILSEVMRMLNGLIKALER